MARNPNILTDDEIRRLLKKVRVELGHADVMAKCLPEELGCAGDVGEGFAESILEAAAKVAAYSAQIKCALRIRRRKYEERVTAAAPELRVRLANLVCHAVACEGDRNHVVPSIYVKEGRATLKRLKKGGQ